MGKNKGNMSVPVNFMKKVCKDKVVVFHCVYFVLYIFYPLNTRAVILTNCNFD